MSFTQLYFQSVSGHTVKCRELVATSDLGQVVMQVEQQLEDQVLLRLVLQTIKHKSQFELCMNESCTGMLWCYKPENTIVWTIETDNSRLYSVDIGLDEWLQKAPQQGNRYICDSKMNISEWQLQQPAAGNVSLQMVKVMLSDV